MTGVSSVQSTRPTHRASLKASTTSSYSHSLRELNAWAGAVSDSLHWPRALSRWAFPLQSQLCPSASLKKMFLSVTPSTIKCSCVKGLVQYEALSLENCLSFMILPDAQIWCRIPVSSVFLFNQYCGVLRWDSLSSRHMNFVHLFVFVFTNFVV